MLSTTTAFPISAGSLASQLREAELDHAAFELPLHSCDLARCRATCCHDGVILSSEEASTIQSLLDEHPHDFADCPASSPRGAFAERNGSPKTATMPASSHELAEDFPTHFPRTRCAFLDDDHKCALQLLSHSLGHHPWFYKPISCWMHPVILRPAKDRNHRPTLTLLSPVEDSARFASCTHCGRPDPMGLPAREVLREELAVLSTIAERDFLAELNAPSAS